MRYEPKLGHPLELEASIIEIESKSVPLYVEVVTYHGEEKVEVRTWFGGDYEKREKQ